MATLIFERANGRAQTKEKINESGPYILAKWSCANI